MPAIVGAVQVITMGSSSVFHIGDVYKIMPVANVRTFTGSGSFNTGERLKSTIISVPQTLLTGRSGPKHFV